MSNKDNKPEMQQIDLTKLNLPQLSQLRKQIEQEIGVFQDSLQTLKLAQTKFSDSKECLDKIQPESEGNVILVPLTGSMFVPGKLADSKKVMVDIGTGYYVNMDIEDAKDYFKRRVAYVTEQMEKIQSIGMEKSRIRDAIMDVIEMKFQAQLAAQKAVQTATS